MYKILEVKRDEIIDTIEESCKELIAPRDDYWEGAVLSKCNHYLIKNNKEEVGYFLLDKDNSIYQFYLNEKYKSNSREIWNFVLHEKDIYEAFVETYDTDYMMLCMDDAKGIEVFAYIYRECREENHIEEFEDIKIQLASMDDLDSIIEFCKEEMELDNEFWLEAYYTGWIKNEGVYIFKDKNSIIAMGEIRTGFRAKEIAYLGAIVAKEYRKLGLGKYVTSFITAKSKELGYKPVCFIDEDNKASNKMVISNGFYAYHRILTVKIR